MKLIFFFLFFLLANVALAGGNSVNTDFIELLKNPEKYDGKVVEIIGFATIEFEGNALYMDSKSQKNASYEKGVWLEIAKTPFELKKYNGSKVLVKGIFKLSNKGHMGLWRGALEQVSKVELVKTEPVKIVVASGLSEF
ncbi:MAG: hypothetical protein HOP07_01945 [Bacteriovoracaceae bacterium]|nr:hypothetical protein [Bacteriovoracaceae bacterium]